MIPASLDPCELPEEWFERRTMSPACAGRVEQSTRLNTVKASAVETLEKLHPSGEEFLVRLSDVTALGSSTVLKLERGVFAPTTIDIDWKHPERFEPDGRHEHVTGEAQFIANRHGDNYFHWTHQSLAALFDLQKAGLPTDRLIVTPLNDWRRRTLELAGVDPDSCIELQPDAVMRIDSAVYSAFASRRTVNRPTQRFIDLFDDFSHRVCGTRPHAGGEKVYISRVGVKRRRIDNEEAVCRLVQRYGFEVVKSEDLSADEQIRLFAGARHVVAPHGAGLVNLLYAQRCESVTEILQAGPFNQCMFRICQAKGIPHYSLQADCVEESDDWRVVSTVDLELLERQLDTVCSGDGVRAA